MARTKQTACKSTARKAPHKQLTTKDTCKSISTTKVAKQALRYRPGTVSVYDIHRYQYPTKPIFKKVAFQYLVREIVMDYRSDIHFQSTAIAALQESAEAYIVDHFIYHNQAVAHVTIQSKDKILARRIRGENI